MTNEPCLICGRHAPKLETWHDYCAACVREIRSRPLTLSARLYDKLRQPVPRIANIHRSEA